jgi:hypothetical protein
MSKYRFDRRSKEEFAADIKSSTQTEAVLLNLWLNYVERNTGERPKFRYTGCGPDDGEFLEDNKVTTHADYEVESVGLVEVKFSKKLLPKFFHLKVRQVESYIKQGATILMVNGSESDSPQFTLIGAADLLDIAKNCKDIPWQGFGGKRSYKVPVTRCIWRSLHG